MQQEKRKKWLVILPRDEIIRDYGPVSRCSDDGALEDYEYES